MTDLESKSNEELVLLMRDLENQYIKVLASKFNKQSMAEMWKSIKEIKEELAKRRENRMS